MLRSAFAASLVFLGSFVVDAKAKDCSLVDDLKRHAANLDVPDSSVIRVDDMGFVRAFVAALGLEMPPNARPVGMLVVKGVAAVYFGLIEEGGIVCNSGVTSHAIFNKAMTKAQESI